MTRFRVYVAILLAITWSASCRPADRPPVAAPMREVRDDLGRPLNVPTTIERAVSLAPSLTEMIFAVGAGDKLVGVTTYCDYPSAASAIEKVGDTQTPNIERIIALRPQIVFLSTASQLEAFSRTLDEQGIAVYVTNPTSLGDVLKNLKQFGELFGRSGDAENLVLELRRRVDSVRSQTSSDGDSSDRQTEQPRVFVQISKEPLFTIGKESFLTELIVQAGGLSVTKDVATAYPKLSKETAAALDPDVIILSDSQDNREPNAVFANSNAVRNDNVHRVNADIISRPGPRLVDALEEIASILKGTTAKR